VRVALDMSPLAGHFPVSVVRTVGPLVDALRRAGEVELVEVAPPPAGRLARLAWRQRALPREAARGGADLLHVFSSGIPLLSRVPVVQTVHELPWRRGVRENDGLAHRAWASLGRRRARAVCVPSESVAEDLGRTARVHVVPWGVGEEFLRGADGDALRAAHPELPEGPFVLAPGATRPKKRLDRIVAGAAALGLPIVVSGAPARADARPPASTNVVALGHVADALMPALYDAAAVTCLFADSEGFALPVLESFARGCPVAAPRGSVQAETAGGLAALADRPDDPADVGAAIERAMRMDAGARAALRSYAEDRTWRATARRLAEVWREVL